VFQPSFEVVAEAIPHVVWLADASGSTDYLNERGTDYTGLPRQANYGWDWVRLVHPDDAERARFGWQHATRTATPFALSYRIRRSDGEFRWHDCHALPVRGPDGEIVRWIGTADDVTDVVHGLDDAARVERQIAELHTMLQLVQESPTQRFGHVDTHRLAHRVGEAMAAAEATMPERCGSPVSAGEKLASSLSVRERAVARLVATGYTNAEIANLLGYSLRTIEVDRGRLRRVMGARTRAELVRLTHEAGLAEDPHLRQASASARDGTGMIP
jgi:PAS domain S-box-containing protein